MYQDELLNNQAQINAIREKGKTNMGNANLRKASRNKKDEFYTQLSDIEDELQHYQHHFKDKIIFMNADDPAESNFWRYFYLNFNNFGLKKIISTHYDPEEPTYKMEYNGTSEPTITNLEQNGDFRSPEVIELLKESDIVVTNPPFSLFREYIAQLIKYNKDFVIMGNNNAITYKDIFPLIKKEKIWLGHNANKTMEFRIPDDYKTWDRVDDDGNKYCKVPAISWFTSLEIPRLYDKLILFKEYNEEDYPTYDNYDAINIDRVANIPVDYKGYMGVPITYLTKHNPDQFELLGIMNTGEENKGIRYLNTPHGRPVVDGVEKYLRILIKRK